MKIVDMSVTPDALNVAVNMKEVAQASGGPIQGITLLARGTVTAGEVKLLGSFDNENFYPIKENGVQLEVEINDFTFIKYRNMYVKCDISNVTSSDLIVEVQ